MASFSVSCPKCPSSFPLGLRSQKASFQSGLRLKPSISFGSLSVESVASRIQSKKQFSILKAANVENSNSASIVVNGPKVASSKEKQDQNGKVFGGNSANESSITTFMSQVSDLVKLVDSRDIVELQLKQSNCELMIRKKEALLPPPVVAPASSPMQYATFPSPPMPSPAAASAPTSSLTPKAAPSLPTPKKASTFSHPPIKSPMAGTFYKSPAPGEPPFVKVGDKVKKGQVVCIIEAMKLMNEIEADRSGTVAEILAEDGKPVSVDTPLFVIAP